MAAAAKPVPGLLSQEVAAILRERMGRFNLTNAQLAKAVGMSPQQIGAVLLAKKHIDVEQLDRICWALGKSLADVTREAEKNSQERLIDPDWTTQRLVD